MIDRWDAPHPTPSLCASCNLARTNFTSDDQLSAASPQWAEYPLALQSSQWLRERIQTVQLSTLQQPFNLDSFFAAELSIAE